MTHSQAVSPVPSRGTLDPISVRATGRWPDIYAALAPDLSEALARYGKHVPCPVHGGHDGFRLYANGERSLRGEGICNTCGRKQNGVVLLSWLYGWSTVETIERVSEVLSGLPARSGEEVNRLIAKVREDERIKAEKARQNARQWWLDGVATSSFKAKPLRRYLGERDLPWHLVSRRFTDDFRFHPALPYFEKGVEVDRFPAMLALARNVDDEVVFMHRTWLAKNGHGKAPVSSARKTTTFFRKHQGAAIRLGGKVSSQLDVAEGIETALSVSVATDHTTWALVNTSLMEQWIAPSRVKFVNIWADKDRKQGGQAAAAALAEVLREEGKLVSIKEPGCQLRGDAKSVDWNDALMQYGPEAFGAFFYWEGAA